MIIDPTAPVLDYEGNKMVEFDVTITYRHLIFQALNTPIQAEPWDVDARMKCFSITQKVTGTGEAELADGEATFIVERANRLGNGVGPLAYCRLREFLLPEPAPVDLSELVDE